VAQVLAATAHVLAWARRHDDWCQHYTPARRRTLCADDHGPGTCVACAVSGMLLYMTNAANAGKSIMMHPRLLRLLHDKAMLTGQHDSNEFLSVLMMTMEKEGSGLDAGDG
jgi:hypothetical protein